MTGDTTGMRARRWVTGEGRPWATPHGTSMGFLGKAQDAHGSYPRVFLTVANGEGLPPLNNRPVPFKPIFWVSMELCSALLRARQTTTVIGLKDELNHELDIQRVDGTAAIDFSFLYSRLGLPIFLLHRIQAAFDVIVSSGGAKGV